jgi:2-C-methyl-D-erythritol 2,4-cyclodiphosphate synthase
MRIGIGYDVHRLVPGRSLVLGGVEIPFDKGLLGHSDADVLIHAVCDALLGAAALGDIGSCFPDSDERYLGISSLALLKEVAAMIRKKGFAVCNVDATVMAEAPKLAAHRDAMRQRIGRTLGVPEEAVSVKATTTEGLGFVGRGEGIAALCAATLKPAAGKEV